ncbi:hypothetical protein [Natronococcus pandeyae]|nr:hypothetical protein [Natronococcus pandeyae]
MVDAGADPEGNESVSSVVQEHIGDDTLLKFPEGEYYMDSQVRLTNFENVGIVGDNATLVPANYDEFDGPQYRLFRLGTSNRPGRDLQFGGFTVDQTASNTGIRVISAEVEDGLSVRNVYIHGVHDSGTWGPGLFNITDPDGSGHVYCFRAFDGGIHIDETPNDGRWRGATGIILNENHRGQLTFESCVLGGFPDNGLYASGSNGEIDVEGGWYENSGTASIRLSGARGSIKEAIAVVDENPEWVNGQHAIRLDRGDRYEIENVTVDAPNPNGEAVRIMRNVDATEITNTRISVGEGNSSAVRIDSGTGAVDVENSEVEIDGDAYAFRILGEDDGTVELRDVDITGDADGSPIRHAIYCERNGCRFHGISVDQPGGNNRAALELFGDDYVIADSEFETTHVPITVNGSDNVRVENNYSRSYEGRHSFQITDDSGSVSFENNDFPGGVRDFR